MSEDKDIVIMFAKERQKTIEQQEEIERLKIIEEKYKDSQLYIKDFKDEIERLNNIIKEVRNWANKTVFYFDFEEEINKHAFDLLYTKQGQELLEILDKGE